MAFFAKKKLPDIAKNKSKKSCIFINENLSKNQRKLCATLRQKIKEIPFKEHGLSTAT